MNLQSIPAPNDHLEIHGLRGIQEFVASFSFGGLSAAKTPKEGVNGLS